MVIFTFLGFPILRLSDSSQLVVPQNKLTNTVISHVVLIRLHVRRSDITSAIVIGIKSSLLFSYRELRIEHCDSFIKIDVMTLMTFS